ncbi:MAG: FecR domain-containing protein [Myxococcota bacterium]
MTKLAFGAVAATVTIGLGFGLLRLESRTDESELRIRQQSLRGVLRAGDRAEVSAGRVLRAQVGNRAFVSLEGPAAMRVLSVTPAGAVRLALDRGRLRSDVISMPGVSYVVSVDEVDVEVLGTVFTVELRDETVDVSVSEGHVRVNGPDGQDVLTAPAAAKVLRRARAESRLDREEPVKTEKATMNAESLQPEASSPPPSQRQSRLKSPQPRARPARAPSPEPRVKPRRSPSELEDPQIQREQKMRPEREAGALPAQAPPSLQKRLSDARTQLDAGDLGEARARAEALRREALSPALLVQVQLLLLELAIARGAHAEVTELSTRVLAGPVELEPAMTAELRYWRGDAARQRGDCEAAVDDLAVAAALRAGPRSEDASWSWGWCLTRLGRFDEARRALEAYIQTYPEGRFRDAAQAWLDR